MTCNSSTPEYQREKCKRFYYARKKRDPEGHCKKQRRNSAAWRSRNPDKVRARSARSYAEKPEYHHRAAILSRNKVKVRVFGAYGNHCCLCNEPNLEVLTIDHVGGWGTIQRRETKRDVLNIIVSEGFPSTYRILCRNCNMRDQFARRRQQGLVGGRAARERERRERLKLETFKHYGGVKCSCCGKYEDDLDVLTLDHTDPCKLGRDRPYSGWRLYEHLKNLGYPLGFSVMCFNCNWLKGRQVQSSLMEA